jgi:hypothetical protein
MTFPPLKEPDLDEISRRAAEWEAWLEKMRALPRLPPVCPRCGYMFCVKPLTTEPLCMCRPDQ